MTSHKYGLGCFGDGTGVYRPQTRVERTESSITSEAMRRLKAAYPDAVIRKIHGGDYQRAGLPDIYVMYLGVSLWIEMKRPGADTTALQKRCMESLTMAGAMCGTAESSDRALQIVEDAMKV